MSTKRSRRQKERASAPPPSRDERVLRERILRFTYQDRFKGDFEHAIRLYFGEEALQDGVLTIDEDQIPGFQEWYICDYVTSEEERIIDLFAREVGLRLPNAQRRILEDWRRTNRYRLFEVQAVEPGVGVTVRDLLSGEVLEVNDISFSRATVRWQVLLARPLLTEGRLCFAGSGLPLPPMKKPDLLEFAQELWEAYRVQHPGSSLDEFYRDHGFDLYRRAREIATGPPPPVYTPEGHPVMASTARYAVRALVAVRERLDQAEEFVFAGRDADDPRAMHYVCLQGEGARVPEIAVEGKGLIMQTDWTAGPGEPTYRALGDVRLWRNRLELSCLSRERLEVGKALLEQILGRLIRHLADEFRDLDTLLASAEPVPPRYEEEVPADIQEALAREAMASHLAEWLDTPVPALDGKSPREASRDPGMREQLEELLKIVEYMEERKRRGGESYVDVADLRRELGLPPR